MTFPSLGVWSVFLFAGLLLGGDKPSQGKGDPQSSFEPRSKPGMGQQFLQKFVGDWEVAKTLHLGGEPIRMTGRCRQTMIHNGRFLQADFVFEHNGTQSTGLGLIGFEAETGKFTSVWTDSRATRMSMRQSKEPFKGDEIVLFSASLNADGKPMRQSRTVTRLEENSNKIVHRQYSAGPDGKEKLFMELVLTRKTNAAAPSR